MVHLDAHQEKGANWLAALISALLFWDQGTGKTYTAIAGALRALAGVLNPRNLVLCPAVARRNWARELIKMGVDPADIVVMEKGDTKIDGYKWVICSYNLAGQAKTHARLLQDWDVLILDELQYLKNYAAKRTKNVLGSPRIKPENTIAFHAERLYALSGTPAPNNISELYPWVSVVAPQLAGRNVYDFQDRYCIIQDNGFGRVVAGNKPEATQILWKGLSGMTSRVRKSDVIKDLPPVRFGDIIVDGDPQYARELKKLEKELTTEINTLLMEIKNGVPSIHALATVRRLTELAKVKPAVDMVAQELADGALEKIVLFASHIDTITALYDGFTALGIRTGYIRGDVSPSKRQQVIDDFHKGDGQVFIGQTVAAGTAITLHADGRCQDVMFLSADYVPGNNAQAVARVHRRGQTGSVLCRFLVVEGSSDEAVTKALMRKTRQLDDVLEGGVRRNHHAQ